jgi:pimeloyl-ACP methyl ester carboxylesterase
MNPPRLLAGVVLALGLADLLSAAEPAPTDIFLLIGQSNMAGRGAVEPEDQVVHPRILKQTEGKAWAPAVDPLHFDKPTIVGVGLASTFARVVAEKEPKAVIGLVPAAFGGTSLEEWAPGGKLYTNAVERAKLALAHGAKLRALLWHQGEADSGPEKRATYAERFAKFVKQLRADLGAPEVPIIVGEIFEGRTTNAPMNEVLMALPKSVPNCASVSAAGLKDKGDQTHFDSPSLREFGRRYAAAFYQIEKSPAKAR